MKKRPVYAGSWVDSVGVWVRAWIAKQNRRAGKAVEAASDPLERGIGKALRRATGPASGDAADEQDHDVCLDGAGFADRINLLVGFALEVHHVLRHGQPCREFGTNGGLVG